MRPTLLLLVLLVGCGSEEPPPDPAPPAPRTAVARRAQSYVGTIGRPRADAPPAEVEVREETSQRGPVRFNGADRENLIDVTITGIEVVFDPAGDGHPLNAYDGAQNVAALTILADVLRIRAPLVLPGTDVVIHARRLVFEDPDEKNAARIDLSARPGDLPPKGVRQPGDAGERGGNLTLYIGSLEGKRERFERSYPESRETYIETLPLRFLSDGSNGGAGGPGIAGKNVKGGNQIASQRGKAATAAELAAWRKIIAPQRGGQGGNGGDAGGLTSTLPAAGDVARRNVGRGGRTPSASGGMVVYYNGTRLVREHGVSKESRPAVEPGKVPEFVELKGPDGDPGAHPEVLRAIVNRVRDLYIGGHIEEAREFCIDTLPWAGNVAFPKDPDLEFAFRVHRGELLTLAERLADDLDYFGNPPGWVPRLSLEANYAVYAGEAEASVRMMFLSYWLTQVWAEREDRIAGLSFGISAKKSDIEEYRQRIRNMKKLLPALERESLAMRRETERFVADLQAVEERVAARFRSDKELRRTLGAVFDALGSTATMLTFVSPWAAPFAAGFMIAGPLTRETAPLVSGGGAGDAFAQILEDEDIAWARDRLAALDPGRAQDVTRFETELAGVSRDLEQATRQFLEQTIRESLAGQVTDDFDAALELNQVITRDEEFRAAYDRLIEIVTLRQVYREKIAEAVADLDGAITGIQEAVWAIDTMEAARRSEERHIDRRARAVLDQMRRRARERLVLYQYYLAKAFEYRMLAPCPVSPLANRVYAAAEQQFGTTAGADKPFDVESPRVKDLVAIYREDLGEIVRATVTGLNTERFDPMVAKAQIRLNDEELGRLNETGEVSLNLESLGAILPDDRNARIAGVRVIESASRFAVDEDAPDGHSAALDLTVEPPERGMILWEDQAFSFFYGGTRSTSVVLGGYTWREPSGTGEPMEPSRGADSLLASMVDKTFGDKNRIHRIHFRPSAHGEIVVRAGTASRPEGIRILVKELALEIDIEKNKTSRR